MFIFKNHSGAFEPVDLVTCYIIENNIKPNVNQTVYSKKILSNKLHCSTHNTPPALLFRVRFNKKSWKIEHKAFSNPEKTAPQMSFFISH